MVFYLVFSLGVGLHRRAALPVIAAALVALAVVGKLFGSLPLPVSYWAKPILLEFVFGMLLAMGYLQGFRLPPRLALALVGTGALLMALAFYNLGDKFSHREIQCGVPAMMIVAGAVFCGAPLRLERWRWLAAIGEASYALYLLHAIPIRAVRELTVRTGGDMAAAPWCVLVLDVVLAVSLALVVHYYFERPLTRTLRASMEWRKMRRLEAVNT
jgi:peptidoglycan/LPS O-acetylase OafA/YrhL